MSVKTYYISKVGAGYALSPHFRLGEFASKDGADKVLISTELIAKLEELRDYGDFSIVINSGYRTASHNRKVGGAGASQHVAGNAADIVVKRNGTAVDARLVCCLCQSLGFKGIGYISETAVHVDMRPYGNYRGDERRGYRGNVKNDFYTYFHITKNEVEALKKKEKESVMTQEQFDKMMDTWIAKRRKEAPAAWSEAARKWAETAEIILGDGSSYAYRSFCTREEMVTFLYRFFAMLPEREDR